MEDVILNGYNRLIDLIQTTDTGIDQRSAVIRAQEDDLVGKMGAITAPVIHTMGITILEKGKKDNQGEIYDAKHYSSRVFVLGKSADPAPYRPDNMSRQVIDQFCLLSEDGKFYEVMYSTDDLVVDSYMGELTPRQLIDLYGYDAVFMLYKGMKQYLEGQEKLLSALEVTLQFLVNSA
ncbi:hypothetical protein [uncultured Methanospirillum sp.]|uniref:hypothetical protein n=1 Tax=uncultured Methanospirillum sp. TaxID=262503 RepID=UPI0029C97605|nr:hypothetical protein [uncultured Methanospirillum sp.]